MRERGAPILRVTASVSMPGIVPREPSARSRVASPTREETRMLCALTVRRLKPGTFDQFREAFMAPITSGAPPEGMVRFDMLRNTADPDEVVCFGFFDGTAEQLRSRVREF